MDCNAGCVAAIGTGLTDYLRWWNTTRIQQRLGYLSPDEYAVLESIIDAKFRHNPDLVATLAATRGSLFVEDNIWHDQT